MRIFASLIGFAFITSSSLAAIKTQTVEYKVGEVTHKGFLAYDDANTDTRPGVLVVHEWWGLNDYAKRRATMLAELGYVAFAPDMFGEGKTTSDPKQANEWATDHGSDLMRARQRVMAAFDQLSKSPHVDTSRLAAIGYCFGGSSVLNMARLGMPLRGVVSFHGGLASPLQAGKGVIKAKVLVCHGAADTFDPVETLDAFRKEMSEAEVDWQMVYYSGAVHAFTNPDADNYKIPGVAYNKAADERSWNAMKTFFAEIFAK